MVRLFSRGILWLPFLLFSLLSLLSLVRPIDASASSSLLSRFQRFHSLTSCDPSATSLTSVNLLLNPWFTSLSIPIDVSLSAGVYSYSVSRAYSHAVLQFTPTAATGATVNVYLNEGIQEPHPLPAGTTLELVLIKGTNTIRVEVTAGTCSSTYSFVIADTGNDDQTCPAESAGVQVQLEGVTLTAQDGLHNVYPVVITPTWDGLHQFFYVAYLGDYQLTTFTFTPTGFSANTWFRYAINHGPWIYTTAVANIPITAPLIDGTNLIQLDVYQHYACGDYIAEYSITIYRGPGQDVLPCDASLTALGSVDLVLHPWFTSDSIPLPLTLQSGVYTYTLTRSVSHAVLTFSLTAPLGTSVNVYLNGVIQQPHPLPAGTALELILVKGTDIIEIIVQGEGDCKSIYQIIITDQGNDDHPCPPESAGVQVQLEGVDLKVTDTSNTVYPLVITPTWDGLHQYFYVAYIGDHNVNGGNMIFIPTGFSANTWFRYAINHGPWIYTTAVANVAITAPLVDGTNLIQLDVYQDYACGDYIAEYSITIYQGPCPNCEVAPPPPPPVPTSTGVVSPPSPPPVETSTGVAPPPSPPPCIDIGLDSLVVSLLPPNAAEIPVTLDSKVRHSWFFYSADVPSVPAGTQVKLAFPSLPSGQAIEVHFPGHQATGQISVPGGTAIAHFEPGPNAIFILVKGRGCDGKMHVVHYLVTLNPPTTPPASKGGPGGKGGDGKGKGKGKRRV